MADINVAARFQIKDAEGLVQKDEEGKVITEEVTVTYDFGDDLDSAVDLCGPEVVFNNYQANAKVQLQSIMRAQLKAGATADAIQAIVDSWKPGMQMERAAVDPAKAVENAFATWTPERQAEFIEKLQNQGVAE